VADSSRRGLSISRFLKSPALECAKQDLDRSQACVLDELNVFEIDVRVPVALR
jgi:hypothetical protein